jgi:hypothetical protein
MCVVLLGGGKGGDESLLAGGLRPLASQTEVVVEHRRGEAIVRFELQVLVSGSCVAERRGERVDAAVERALFFHVERWVVRLAKWLSRLLVEVAVSGLNLLVGVGAVEIAVFPIDVASDDLPATRPIIGGDGFEDESFVLLSGLKGQGFAIGGDEEAWIPARKGVSTSFDVLEELFVFVSGHSYFRIREKMKKKMQKVIIP